MACQEGMGKKSVKSCVNALHHFFEFSSLMPGLCGLSLWSRRDKTQVISGTEVRGVETWPGRHRILRLGGVRFPLIFLMLPCLFLTLLRNGHSLKGNNEDEIINFVIPSGTWL